MLLPKLKKLESAYDSLYDFNSKDNYSQEESLKKLEKIAGEYGYKFVLNSKDKFKLKRLTDK